MGKVKVFSKFPYFMTNAHEESSMSVTAKKTSHAYLDTLRS